MSGEHIFSAWLALSSFSTFIFAIISFNRISGYGISELYSGLTLLTLGYFLTVKFILSTGLRDAFPHIIGTANPLWLLFGPGLYLWIQKSTQSDSKFHSTDVLHILPFVCYLCFLADFYALSGVKKLEAFEFYQTQPLTVTPFFLFTSLLIIGYFFLSWYQINRFRIHRTENPAFPGRLISWFGTLVLITAIYFIFDFGHQITLAILEKSDQGVFLITQGIISVWGIGLGGLFVHLPLKEIVGFSLKKEKYRTSYLTEADIEMLLAELSEHMKRHKPFLDEGLGLTELAGELNWTSHRLSQLINGGLGKNFYHFVNGYRVQEAKERLLDRKYESYTILAIAQEVGFKSKTTFNRLFKSETGYTPSEFIKRFRDVRIDE